MGSDPDHTPEGLTAQKILDQLILHSRFLHLALAFPQVYSPPKLTHNRRAIG